MQRPNIILIAIDDLGWRDLACYGSGFYETPNLDRLAASGMQFTDAYASCPVCSPTRASILTGKYPANVGITNFIGGHAEGKLASVPYLDHLPLSETSIASALRRGGYATWHVGKWHLGDEAFHPDRHGFDVNTAGCHWGYPHQGYFSPYGLPTLSDGPPGEYLTDRLTNEAIQLIQNHRDSPYFLNLWHFAVHTPIQCHEALVEKYRRKAQVLGLDQLQTFETGEHFPCLHKQQGRIQRRLVQSDPTYAAMIENLDANIGRLLRAVDESGQRDDTLVVFTSDNGGLSTAEGSPTSNLPLIEGKGWMYEGGTRVCQLASWPGRIRAASRCMVPVTSTDLYPTLLEAAGLELMPEQHQDGVSLMPLLMGADRIEREALFWHYPHYSNQGGTPAAAVRAGDHKLIEFFEDGKLELYNLRADISEQHDLCQSEPEKARELHARLVDWRQSIEAKIPAPNPHYEGRRLVPGPDIDSGYI
jgi:arylsulfatase A-like enzyme